MKKLEEKKLRRCYIYTRVSTGLQVDGYSLDAQRDLLVKYADMYGMKITREFSDEGKSGKSVEGRPEFQRMMKYIEAGDNVDFVLVFKLSRFGRNAADVLSSLQRMQDYGVNLICVQDGIDSSKDSGKLVISVLAAVTEIERENILNQTMAGRREKARQGKWNGGQAPYGYKLEKGVLIIVPEEAEHIRMIYDMYLNQNMGLAYIAHYLTDRGYRKARYKNGKLKEFTPAFIKGVLDNPVYMGKIAYGRRRTEKVEGTRNDYHIVKQADYGLYDGLHEAIIPEETWMKVRERRLTTGVPNEKRYSLDHVHVLSGLLKCPVCGEGMYGNVNRKPKRDGSGEYYADQFYYCCKHRKLVDDHRCDYSRQWPQWRINREALEAVIAACNSDEYIESVRQHMNAEIDTEAQEKELNGLYETKRQIEVSIKKLSEQMDNLSYTDDMYDRKYDDLQARQSKQYDRLAIVEANIERLDAKIQRILHQRKTIGDIMLEATRYFREWSQTPEQEHRELFRQLIQEIEIFPDPAKDERIIKRIRFKFPLPYDNEPNVQEVRWDKDGHEETVCCLYHQKKDFISVPYEPKDAEYGIKYYFKKVIRNENRIDRTFRE